MKRLSLIKTCIIAIFIVLLAAMLYACTPYIEAEVDRYPVDHESETNLNLQYPPHSTVRKDQVVSRATDAMDNLLRHLDTDKTAVTGYYAGADIVINTADINPNERSAFRLKLRANLYTYPYELKDEQGNVILGEDGQPLIDEVALAIHNERIKYNDIELEWYDAMTNTMLIGFYFDGINPNSADPGNHLYLNLQGSKRKFIDFGDSVLYQQIVRLITKFDMNSLFGGDSNDEDSGLNTIANLLQMAVTTNYKEVINKDEVTGDDITSLFFYDINLGDATNGQATDMLTEYMQDIFSPFEDKLDPLTNKYLGFKFSTLGTASITRLVTSLQYFLSTPSREIGEILTGLIIDLDGDSIVLKKGVPETVPFTARMSFDYALRISTNIVITDKMDYKDYEYGNYEYIGNLFIPMLDLELDALIRTDVNENNPSKGLDNSTNRVFAQFYDKSNNDVIIGMYYKDELTYIDITNLQHLYGGIKFEDIGLPKAYKEGFDLGNLLKTAFEMVDKYIVLMVDSLLGPKEEDSNYDNLTKAIMDNMESTMKDPDDPSSRNTIKIKIDIELIRKVMKETSEHGTEYTNKQMINLINEMFGIELESIAAIMGMSLETLMDTTFIHVTYDVDDYGICIEVFNSQNNPAGDLVLKLDLWPTHVGEAVTIAFPRFDNFKPLQEVMTYSGYMEGQIMFAATEEVVLSDLMGAFIGDLSGKNTPYVLPDAANIYFTMYYDQYIRDQVLENGRWTRAGRSAFNLHFYVIQNDERVDLFRVYANDVSFNTSDSVEELGYVWVDLICVPDMPRLKIREDHFIESFYMYMGEDVTDDETLTVGLTTILQAMIEDSWPQFEPDVIRITTSNQSFKDFFRVDELIATIEAQVGFKQRVKNIDELEVNFAMYTVGEFTNIQGDSPYEVVLHPTIPVYFDFGNRLVTKHLLFNYQPESIRVRSNTDYYYPTIDGLFMGAVRGYQLRITGGNRGRSQINYLAGGDEVWVWEPLLGAFPTRAMAFYGDTANQQYNYLADFDFYAYYDKTIDYYIVPNDLGYKILYDHRHDIYIVDLDENHKIDKVYEIIDPEENTILVRNVTTVGDIKMVYDIGGGQNSYYVVQNNRTKILYNVKDGFYLVEDASHIADARFVVGDDAVIYTLRGEHNGNNLYFDMSTGYYIYQIQGWEDYRLLYDHEGEQFYVQNILDRDIVSALLGAQNVYVASSDIINWDRVDFTKAGWNKVDWLGNKYKSIDWQDVSWETMTLEGGIFIVEVVIGRGMMATYRELINVKLLNRTVETDKYVNINLFDETTKESYKVKAPVVNYIDIDPYVYIFLKADYENNLKSTTPAPQLRSNFVEWIFEKYLVKIAFTKIYGNEQDTADEIDNFLWSFDYPDEQSTYREQNISNRVAENTKETTYIYTNLFGQIVALGVNVLPRNIDYIKIDGEEEKNTYTVDALLEETFVIPRYPVIYFKELDNAGNPYTLDFRNYSPEVSTIFSTAIVQLSSNNISARVVPPEMTRLDSIINWSNPVAENVKLVNEIDPNTGTVLPFYRSNTNITTSFVDIRNFVDPTGSWFHSGWFSTPVVEVAVLIPDKVVDTLEKVIDGETYYVSDISVQQSSDNGLFYVDPYDVSTWELTSNVMVRFRNSDGTYHTKDYDIIWQENEYLEIVNGKFIFKNITKNLNYFYLDTQIGNEEVNYIDLRVLAINLSGEVYRIEFLGSDGQVLAGSLDDNPYYITPGESDTYAYEVDTYSRFEIPSGMRILFADGSIRTYATNWGENAPWAPGVEGEYNAVRVSSTLGTRVQEEVPLTYLIEPREITAIEVLNGSNLETITYSIPNKTISVSGVNISGGRINGKTPYEYFVQLFEGINLTFASPSVFGQQVLVTDALLSEIYLVERTFDTQKLISSDGQTFLIQMGQGRGADDYYVTIKATGASPINDGAIDTVIVEPFDIETNEPNYGPDKSFVIDEEIILALRYNVGWRDITNFPNPWFVMRPEVMPSGYNIDDVSSTMYGINEGDNISEITWDTMIQGGYVWITTMLDDSSRVYRRLEIAYVDIGSNYDSAVNDPSPFVIKDGKITISDIYGVYPIDLTLETLGLPTSIVVDINNNKIAIPVRHWEIQVNSAFLSRIDYRGQGEFLLATAVVVGETLELWMEVLPCFIEGIAYYDNADSSKNFESNDEKTINFDAYRNSGYNGALTLPLGTTLKFAGGATHKGDDIRYEARNIYQSYNLINVVPYNITGHTLNNMADDQKVDMRIRMPDGQVFEFSFYFYNKTVTSILVEGIDGVSYVGTYDIDPYGEVDTNGNHILPRNVTVQFEEGFDLSFFVSDWTKPANYEVKYDTYQRVLAHLPNARFSLTAPLAYPNLQRQTLNLGLRVVDRVMDNWTIVDGYTDFVGGNRQNPNAFYHYTDPLAGRASWLPQTVINSNLDNPIHLANITQLPIVWSFGDSDISAEGTVIADIYGKYGKIVRGYLKDERYGQPITIRVYVNKWEFDGIRRPLGDDYQIMSEEIRFFFSTITDASSYSNYQVIIRESVPNTSGGGVSVSHKNVIFYPEDINAPSQDYPYRIIWDEEAKLRARANDLGSSGRFYLGNDRGQIKMYPSNTVYYQYERPNISELDLGFGYGTHNNAIYVVNPLNPNFTFDPALPGVTKGFAKGVLNQDYDAELGEVDIYWSNTSFSHNYLKGGVYIGYTVTVTLTRDTYEYSQQFGIKLVFLDMSPTTALYMDSGMGADIPHTLSSTIKTSYAMDTYYGMLNPYRDAYNQEMVDALNLAVEKLELDIGTGNQIICENIVWEIPDEQIPRTVDRLTTIYSKTVTIGGRIYNTNFVRLVIRP